MAQRAPRAGRGTGLEAAEDGRRDNAADYRPDFVLPAGRINHKLVGRTRGWRFRLPSSVKLLVAVPIVVDVAQCGLGGGAQMNAVLRLRSPCGCLRRRVVLRG